MATSSAIKGLIRDLDDAVKLHIGDDEALIRYLEKIKSEIDGAAAMRAGIEGRAAFSTLADLFRLPACELDVPRRAEIARRTIQTMAQSRRDGRTIWSDPLTLAGTLVGAIGALSGAIGTTLAVYDHLTGVPAPVIHHLAIRNPQADATPLAFTFLHLGQAFIILWFILRYRPWLKTLIADLGNAVPVAKATLVQFTTGWSWMWYGWFVLYMILAGTAFFQTEYGRSAYANAAADVVNVFTGIAIWWCFLCLDLPSVKLPAQENRDRQFRRSFCVAVIVGIVAAVLVVSDYILGWHNFGIAAGGLYNGLALASLTGRLGSHYMAVPRWMLLSTYAYAMLQVIYSFIYALQFPPWIPLVFMCALAFKLILAAAAIKMLEDGGLCRYLIAADVGLLSSDWRPEDPAAVDELMRRKQS
jgi:hypothetical protein